MVRGFDGRADRVQKPGVGHSGAKPRRGPGRGGWEGGGWVDDDIVNRLVKQDSGTIPRAALARTVLGSTEIKIIAYILISQIW